MRRKMHQRNKSGKWKFWAERVRTLDEGRKKIRMCLIFVVTMAVIIGFIYYFHDVKGNHGVNEGTLIKRREKQIEEKDARMKFATSDNGLEEKEIQGKCTASDNRYGGGQIWRKNQILYI